MMRRVSQKRGTEMTIQNTEHALSLKKRAFAKNDGSFSAGSSRHVGTLQISNATRQKDANGISMFYPGRAPRL